MYYSAAIHNIGNYFRERYFCITIYSEGFLHVASKFLPELEDKWRDCASQVQVLYDAMHELDITSVMIQRKHSVKTTAMGQQTYDTTAAANIHEADWSILVAKASTKLND